MRARRHEPSKRLRGLFVMVPLHMMEPDAGRDLSSIAVRLLQLIVRITKIQNASRGMFLLEEGEAAEALEVDLNTVVGAFVELIDLGYIRGGGHLKALQVLLDAGPDPETIADEAL